MSMIPAPNCFGNCPNPQGIYVNSAVGGCPPTHPNSQMPNCAPPQQVQCDSCNGGMPVTNMFPMQPPGGGPSCPTGWTPTIPGVNPCVITPPPPPPPPPATLTGITTTFIKNINSGLSRFGCSFLYNRHAVQLQKLAQLQSAGTNPLWQQMLQNRVSYINNLITNNCILYQTQPPLIPTNPNTAVSNQQMMNASGTNGQTFGPIFTRVPGSAKGGEYNPDVPITNRGSTRAYGDPTIPPYRGTTAFDRTVEPPDLRSTPKFMGGSEPGTFMNQFDGGDDNYSNLTERHHLKPQKRTQSPNDIHDQAVRVAEVIGTWMN